MTVSKFVGLKDVVSSYLFSHHSLPSQIYMEIFLTVYIAGLLFTDYCLRKYHPRSKSRELAHKSK